jgi:hypothetical protein
LVLGHRTQTYKSGQEEIKEKDQKEKEVIADPL